jgi:hypothetical protein
MKNITVKKIVSALLWTTLFVGVGWLMFHLVFNVFTRRNPQDMTIDRQGYLYISDRTTGQVRKFTPEGEQKATFGDAKAPFSLGNYLERSVVDARGNVYLVLNDTHIKKYDANGNFLLEWNTPDTVTGLAADSAGNLYLKYQRANIFQKLDGNGKLLKEWRPAQLTGDTRFDNIFIDAGDNIYAAHSATKTLYKFDRDGSQLAAITGIADLSRRYTVDQNGYVYTFDYINSHIQKWDWNGKLVKTWGERGDAPGQLDFRYKYDSLDGIVADERGYLFIVYENNDQAVVQQYDTDGRFIRRWTDGYPNGFIYLPQLVLVLIILPVAVYLGRRFGASRNPRFLTPTPLPESVIAAGHAPELLSDSMTYREAPPKSLLKNDLRQDTARKYIEQALGTFAPAERTTKSVPSYSIWDFNNPNILLLNIATQIYFPAAMFVVMSNPRFGLAGGWVMALFAGVCLLVFGGLVAWMNRWARANPNKPRLTRSDLLHLFKVTGLVSLSYIAVCLLIDVVIGLVVSGELKSSMSFSSGATVLVMGAVAVIVLSIAVTVTRNYWLYAPYNEGKYEQTVRRAGFMRRLFDNAKIWVLEAEAYRRAGKLDEAEKVYYEAMTHTAHQQANAAGLLLEGLALVRMEQGRYAESLYMLEKAYDLNPERNTPLVYAAENYARARVNLKRAWQLLSVAQAKSTGEKPFERANRLSIEVLLLGYGGDFANAQMALEKTLAAADYKFKPSVAEIHLRAALLADMQGNDAAALEHYRQVQLNDPFGVNGTRASRILRFSPTLQPANV